MNVFVVSGRLHLSNFDVDSFLMDNVEQKPDLVNFGFWWILFIFVTSELRQNFINSVHMKVHLKLTKGHSNKIFQELNDIVMIINIIIIFSNTMMKCDNMNIIWIKTIMCFFKLSNINLKHLLIKMMIVIL